MKPVLLTGAAGHLGGAIAEVLANYGIPMRMVLHTDKSPAKRFGDSAEVVYGNLSDRDFCEQALAGCSAVIHSAAIIDVANKDKDSLWAVNVEGTRHLAEAALRNPDISRFIHIGSVHIYEQLPSGEMLDESRTMVGSVGIPYDVTKAEAHRVILDLVSNGLPAIVLNPSSIIGPPDFKPSLVGQALEKMLNGKVPALFPGGFDFTDVRDVAKVCVQALREGQIGESYILGGKFYTMKELSVALGNAAGKQLRIPVIPFWLGRLGLPFISLWSKLSGKSPLYTNHTLTILEEANRYVSSEKAKQAFGYSPRLLEDTLRDLLTWKATR
jgi:dihydroflavonol-4-reductase